MALPCPPTPITATFNLFDGEQLIRLGIKNAPAVNAPADIRKSLLVFFMVVYDLNNIIFKYIKNTADLILLSRIVSAYKYKQFELNAWQSGAFRSNSSP